MPRILPHLSPGLGPRDEKALPGQEAVDALVLVHLARVDQLLEGADGQRQAADVGAALAVDGGQLLIGQEGLLLLRERGGAVERERW
jgi:hypothetical protein